MAKRKPKTGNYSSRDALVQNIHYLFHHENKTIAQISDLVGVSESIAIYILKPRRTLPMVR